MKAIIRYAVIVPLGIMAGFCAAYFGMALYYQDGFALNTWMNGVYCTGKDVETVSRELLAVTQVPETIHVYGKADEDGSREEWVLSTKELELSVDYTSSLQQYLREQNPFLWIDNFTLHRTHTIFPEVQYNEEALAAWCSEQLAEPGEAECRIIRSAEEGYSLLDDLDDRLDTEAAYAAVAEALQQLAGTVELETAGCYRSLSPTAAQERTRALWDTLEAYQSSGPVYDLGDGAWQIPAGEMAGLLVRDETTELPVMDADGRLQVCEDTIADFIEALAQEHDTYGKAWEFTNTAGETVTVQGGTYGTSIRQKTEVQWLEEYLSRRLDVTIVDAEGKTVMAADETEEGETAAAYSGSDGTAQSPHLPSYTREAFCRSSTTLGDTYIEVDMGRQKLYYYQDGELLIETDVVTGNMRRGFDTPEGVNFVYNKQTDRILRGENYATPVDYWMPVKGAIGIHDADWRSEFGGDIYLTDGSHGCVNVPPEVMSELYELVEIGTPVVMFY